jgi:HEAT repeat protein
VDQQPLQVLFAALRMDDCLVQAEAARLLGELRAPQATGPLVDYVRYSRWYAKTSGFHALAQIGDRSVCKTIRPLVDLPNCSDDWYWYGCKSVRASAAVALLALGDDSGAPYLEGLAEKNDDVLYAWFAPAVLRLPDELAATVALKATITVESFFDMATRTPRRTDPSMVAMGAEALGLVGSPAARDALLCLLAYHSRYVRGQAAVSLLGASSEARHIAAVAELAEKDPTDFVRIKAAAALCTAGRAQYVGTISAAIRRCEDDFDRAVAVEALGRLGREEDLELVASQLGHRDPYVRQCAVESLDDIGGQQAHDAVSQRMDDPDLRVRLQAAKFFARREGVRP